MESTTLPEFIKNYENRGDLPDIMELPTVVEEETTCDKQTTVTDDDPEIIHTPEDEDDPDIPETEVADGAEDDDTSDDWEQIWEQYVQFCHEHEKHPLGAIAENISEVNSDIYTALMFIVRRLSIEEILEIKKKVAAGGKKEQKNRDVVSSKPQIDRPLEKGMHTPTTAKSEDQHSAKDASGPETAVIHLQKGLDLPHIKEFVVRIDAQLQEKAFERLNVITNDWDSSGEFFALIPAAKKLFAKYSEAGLLGCLLSHNYQDAAKKLYCIAYAKGKKTGGDNVTFSGIDQQDYRTKAKASIAAYALILKSVGVARTKKAPLEFLR